MKSDTSAGRVARVTCAWLLAAVLGACANGADPDALVAERDRLRQRVGELELSEAGLQARMEEQQARMAEMRETHARLVAELREEIAAGDVKVHEMSEGVRLDVSEQILFESGSARLSDSGRAVLQKIAAQIQQASGIVSVEGHADDHMIGESLQARYPSNWELAGARAARVVRRLSALGVDPKRLRAVSYGPFHPVASNDTDEGRSRNRRTEIVLHPGNG